MPANGSQGFGLPAWLGRPVRPEDLRHDGNIFNLMRLILASAVIFSHGYALAGDKAMDPSYQWLPFTISRLAVLLFFTLSGFLVTPGLMKRGPKSFATARALRLVPGLWVMLIVTSALVLWLFTSVPALENRGLWNYLGRNLMLYSGGYSISGAFAGQPLPDVVNGSLWTIAREVQCYALLALAAAIGALADRRVMLLLWVGGIILHMALPFDLVPLFEELRWLAISFFAGVLLYLWHERILLSLPLLVALAALSTLADAGPWRQIAVALAAAYGLITLGMLAPAGLKRFSGRMPDYSYGMYIYAFPAQQAAVALGLGITPETNMLAGFLLALPFAVGSWHFVEKPALARKPGARSLTAQPRSA